METTGSPSSKAAVDSLPSKNPPDLPLTPYTGSSTQARQQFIALSTRLIGDIGEPNDFREAAIDLYELFNEIGGRPQDVIGAEAFSWQQETLLPIGKAINPYSAATCLLDYARTRAFACGVYEAIKAAKVRFPGGRIEILYAGTGPYAPLALMQTPFFSADEVRFTLIDVHEPALSCLAQIVDVLGLENYIEQTVQADATRWTPPGEKQYHIAVTEVMQRALIVEPQVAVTLALVKHICQGGFLVPERIELTLCLLDPGTEHTLSEACEGRLSEYFRFSGDSIPDVKETEPHSGSATDRRRIIIGSPFVLTDSTAQTCELSDAGHIRLPSVQLADCIPPELELRVLTGITTAGSIVLGDYDSGLTIPEPVFGHPPLTPGGWYEIWYETRGIPGLRLQPTDQPGSS